MFETRSTWWIIGIVAALLLLALFSMAGPLRRPAPAPLPQQQVPGPEAPGVPGAPVPGAPVPGQPVPGQPAPGQPDLVPGQPGAEPGQIVPPTIPPRF